MSADVDARFAEVVIATGAYFYGFYFSAIIALGGWGRGVVGRGVVGRGVVGVGVVGVGVVGHGY
jgi:hypothetical protein